MLQSKLRESVGYILNMALLDGNEDIALVGKSCSHCNKLFKTWCIKVTHQEHNHCFQTSCASQQTLHERSHKIGLCVLPHQHWNGLHRSREGRVFWSPALTLVQAMWTQVTVQMCFLRHRKTKYFIQKLRHFIQNKCQHLRRIIKRGF